MNRCHCFSRCASLAYILYISFAKRSSRMVTSFEFSLSYCVSYIFRWCCPIQVFWCIVFIHSVDVSSVHSFRSYTVKSSTYETIYSVLVSPNSNRIVPPIKRLCVETFGSSGPANITER